MREADVKWPLLLNGRVFNAAFWAVVRESGSYHRSAHQAVTSCTYFLLVSKLKPALFGLFGLYIQRLFIPAGIPVSLYLSIHVSPTFSPHRATQLILPFALLCTLMSECSAWNENNTTKTTKFYKTLKCHQCYDPPPPPRIRFPRSPRPSPATCPS